MYIFSSVLGVFVFDRELNIVDELQFKSPEDCQNKEKFIEEMKGRHKNLEEPDEQLSKKIRLCFRDKRFISRFYSQNLQLTKYDVKNSVNSDILIIQSVNLIAELDKVINFLAKRLREWYELHNPELSRAVGSNEEFVGKMLEKDKGELLAELGITPNESIGADFKQEDLEPLRGLAHQIFDLYQLRKGQECYISTLMSETCPNLRAVCGDIIGARLIGHARSLKRLSEMPASTVQILGAEKALFRHMKTGAKPPRHGIIVGHPLIAKSPDSMHGRIARALADKISIASKVDYFQGRFIGDKLKEELERKFEKW